MSARAPEAAGVGDLPLTIEEAGAALRSGRLSALALTEALLARADALDARLGVYQHRLDEQALAEAARADVELAAGRDRGALHGIPLGVKDIVATRGAPTSAGSLVFERRRGDGWAGERDAPVVARLREAGAVILGTTSTMEFAIGMPDPDRPFPIARNPWDTERWAGGSSSGTGAGVAAALMLGGLGSDTGGSIRIPAALCGVSGLKPTYGRVPRSSVVPLSFSLDTVGPIARSARCCALLLEALAGPDAGDPASAEEPVPRYSGALNGSLEGVRLGVDRANHLDRPGDAPELTERFEAALAELAAAGAELVPIELARYDVVRQSGSLSLRAEASAYHLPWLREHWGEYGVHTGKVLAAGLLLSSADYVQAQRVRAWARREVATLLDGVDAIVTPTAGVGAPLLAGLDDLSFGRLPIFAGFWNAIGFPAIAVPMGATEAGPGTPALPLSVQIAGRPFDEATVLRVADAYQRRSAWHRQLPPLAAPAG
jgi:aspartyl-tRNA(Asn)/glutamyl-tRNA(Gln) amidotransferase subunit A